MNHFREGFASPQNQPFASGKLSPTQIGAFRGQMRLCAHPMSPRRSTEHRVERASDRRQFSRGQALLRFSGGESSHQELFKINTLDQSIELALAGGAQAIVTHNLRDLRGGELHLGTLRVLTPAQCLEEWE